MANIAIFRINYKSDFILTLNSDAGWMTPFCIKFWTGAPSQAYFAGYDGTTYTHCAPVEGEPTKLAVQFDDHHLPIGDLKFQIGYHFTVADFPTSVEDEVINQAAVIIDQDGTPMQVMLDLNGETAPEIQFSLPAYANEAQRIANEQQRIAAETQRIANEQQRIAAETQRIANEETRIANEQTRINQEQTRQQNEQQRINQEQARVNEYASLKADAVAATGAANDAAALANQKAQLAADKAALAQAAADLANAKAQLATDKAALAASAAQLANDKAALAQQKAEYAQTQGGYAKDQGDYAKDQGDYAKAQGDYAKDQGDYAKAKGDYAKDQGDYAKEQGDYAKDKGDICAADHQTAVADHQTATADHTQAGNDHTRAESDHTRAESDHDAVELYVDSLGVFDLSKHNAVGGVLATYADLSAALTALNALESKYKYGGMSFKFVHSSDNKYVQFRCMAQNFTTDVADWQGVDDTVTLGSKNVVESNAVAEQVTFLSSPINPVTYQNYRRIIDGKYVANTSAYARYKGVSFAKMSAGDKLIFNLTGSDSVNNAFDIGEFTFSSGKYSPTDNQQALTSITGTVAGNQISYTMQNDANVVICLSRDLTVTLTKVEKTVKEAISDIESEVNGISGDISTLQGSVTNITNTLNSADDTVEYGSEDLVKSGAVAKELVLLSEPPIIKLQTANYARIIDGKFVRNAGTYGNYKAVSFLKVNAGDKLVLNLSGTDTTNINYEVGEFIFVQAQYMPTDNQQALAYVSGVINGSTVFYTMQNDANVVICLSRQFTVTLQKQTGTVKEKVVELDSRMGTAESEISSLMPTQPYIAEAEEATKDAQAYPADLKLAVFSDPHTWNRTTYQVLDEINKLGTVDFVAGLGDFQPYDTTAVKAESMLSLAKMMSVSGRNLGLYVVGNHDIVPNSSYVNNGTYSDETALSKNEVFDCFDRHLNKVAVFDEDNPYGGYYYVDFSASKVRIIVLNTSDIWNSAGTITKHYKQAMTIQQTQVDWFMNKALDFSNIQNKEDWGVLILSHNIVNTENLSAVIYPILIAFKNGESVNTSVTLTTAYGSEEKDVITIVHDFSEQGSMDVIAIFGGHTHVYNEYPTNTPTIGARQVREVTFDADNKAFNEFYQKEFDSLPAGEYYFVAAAVTLVFTLSDSYDDVIFKYKRYGIGTTRQAGFSIINKDSGDVLYGAYAVEGTPSAGATELTGFVSDMPDGTANTEQCYIVGIDRSDRILHIVPYGHGTEKTVNY